MSAQLQLFPRLAEPYPKGFRRARAWHVTPAANLSSILASGLEPRTQEPHNPPGVCLFKTKAAAFHKSIQWLCAHWRNEPLCLIELDMTGLALDWKTGHELMTDDGEIIQPHRIIKLSPFYPVISSNDAQAA